MTTQQDSVDVERLRAAITRVQTAVDSREAGVLRDVEHRHRSGDYGYLPDRKFATVGGISLDDLQIILAALSLPITQRDEQGGVWRGIADAPRDGSEIVGWDEATGTKHVTSWDHDRWHDPDSHYYSEAPVFEPTLFCTLPRLSIEQGDQDGGEAAEKPRGEQA